MYQRQVNENICNILNACKKDNDPGFLKYQKKDKTTTEFATTSGMASTTDLTSAPGPMLIRRTIQQLYNDHIWSKHLTGQFCKV